LEHPDGAVRLAIGGPPDVYDIAQPFQIDSAVHTQIRPDTLGILALQLDIDFYCSIDGRRVNSDDTSWNNSIACVDGCDLADGHVFDLSLCDLQFGLQSARFRDFSQDCAGSNVLAGLYRNL